MDQYIGTKIWVGIAWIVRKNVDEKGRNLVFLQKEIHENVLLEMQKLWRLFNQNGQANIEKNSEILVYYFFFINLVGGGKVNYCTVLKKKSWSSTISIKKKWKHASQPGGLVTSVKRDGDSTHKKFCSDLQQLALHCHCTCCVTTTVE